METSEDEAAGATAVALPTAGDRARAAAASAATVAGLIRRESMYPFFLFGCSPTRPKGCNRGVQNSYKLDTSLVSHAGIAGDRGTLSPMSARLAESIR